jgi:hypothetical protein
MRHALKAAARCAEGCRAKRRRLPRKAPKVRRAKRRRLPRKAPKAARDAPEAQ